MQDKTAKDKSLLEAGLKIRRQVLGDAHVDRSMNNANDFNREFQEYITQAAWGLIWTREGLDLKTRSLIVLAITA
jgi:4-carboxymuconolactone decarboxylase